MMQYLCDPERPNWPRRLLTTPLVIGAACLLLLAFPLVVAVAVAWDLGHDNRWSACRAALFFLCFLWCEVLGLAMLLWHWIRHQLYLDDASYEAANRRMQQWWIKLCFGVVTQVFDVTVDVEGTEELNDSTPFVLLVRHASTLDTLLPLALSDVGKRFGYVLKAELLLDPALDYCGHRFDNAFVHRGAGDNRNEIQKVVELGNDLGDDDAVVMYPEGTRFSDTKRLRLLEKYADDPSMLSVVESLHSTLPPLREGVIQLLANTEKTDVVVMSHRGIDDAGDMSSLVGGALTGADLEVRLWRIGAGDIERSEAGIRQFLVDQWQLVDAFASGDEPPPQKTKPGAAAANTDARVAQKSV